MSSLWIVLGAASAFLSVAAGAFGAHALREHLDVERQVIWETAARYQMYHALGLIAVGLLAGRSRGRAADVAGWGFAAGTVLFSGSLYALAVTGVRWLGAITPLGGVGFLAGWLALGVAAMGIVRSGGGGIGGAVR